LSADPDKAPQPSIEARAVAKPRALRSHLLVLTLGTLLPVVLFAIAAALLLAQREQATFERGARERALAMLTAVDSELKGSINTLKALAASRFLDNGDLAAFHAQAARVASSQPDWFAIHLAAPTGEKLLDTLTPYGTPLLQILENGSFQSVIRTGQPAVGDLAVGQLTREYDFPVRVAVTRNGAVKYVLSAVVKPRAISALLLAQRLPPDWIGVVLDRNNRIVARTVAPEKSLGQPASDSLSGALARSSEGWFHGSTIEGAEVYTPYHRSSFSGWTFAMGIPAAVVELPARRTAWAVFAGAVVATLLAVLLAHVLGRSISSPITRLAAAAREMLQGKRVAELPEPRVREIAQLGRSLDEAIGDSKRAEAQLRQSEERHRTLVSVITDVPWTSDAQGAFVTLQPAWSAYTGQSWEQARGFGWVDALHPDDRIRIQAAWTEAREARSRYATQGRLWHARTGQHRHFEVHALPLLDDLGNVKEWIGCCTDIHERRTAEDALQAADRRKDEFLATLAHELRNPLAPIANGLEIMKHAPSNAAVVEQVRGTMQRQVAHMVRLIDDLLDVSRIARDKLDLQKENIELATIIHHALEACAPLIQRAGHVLTVELPDEPIQVKGDPVRLTQVFGNLLANACKYSEPGGQVGIHVARRDAIAIVRVRDSGIGIAPEMLSRIFDLFTQLDRTPGHSRGGLGIGLTLVKRLVELHGGTVSVRSDGEGKGSEFTVQLPVATEELRMEVQPVPAAAARSAPRRILVVDDNRDAATSLAILLRMGGHDVAVAYDGIEAVERAALHGPDVVFLDIGLPGMNGYDVCRALRTSAKGERVLMIAVTGWGQEEDRRRSRDAGFDAHLVKPVDYAAVVAALAREAIPV
jgi:PAS domain S-box-containing protein